MVHWTAMQLCRTRTKKIPKKDTASAREGLKKKKQEREIKRKGGHG